MGENSCDISGFKGGGVCVARQSQLNPWPLLVGGRVVFCFKGLTVAQSCAETAYHQALTCGSLGRVDWVFEWTYKPLGGHPLEKVTNGINNPHVIVKSPQEGWEVFRLDNYLDISRLAR